MQKKNHAALKRLLLALLCEWTAKANLNFSQPSFEHSTTDDIFIFFSKPLMRKHANRLTPFMLPISSNFWITFYPTVAFSILHPHVPENKFILYFFCRVFFHESTRSKRKVGKWQNGFFCTFFSHHKVYLVSILSFSL